MMKITAFPAVKTGDYPKGRGFVVNSVAGYLRRVLEDYEKQCRLERTLAEELFDARKVVQRMPARALA